MIENTKSSKKVYFVIQCEEIFDFYNIDWVSQEQYKKSDSGHPISSSRLDNQNQIFIISSISQDIKLHLYFSNLFLLFQIRTNAQGSSLADFKDNCLGTARILSRTVVPVMISDITIKYCNFCIKILIYFVFSFKEEYNFNFRSIDCLRENILKLHQLYSSLIKITSNKFRLSKICPWTIYKCNFFRLFNRIIIGNFIIIFFSHFYWVQKIHND